MPLTMWGTAAAAAVTAFTITVHRHCKWLWSRMGPSLCCMSGEVALMDATICLAATNTNA